MKESVAIYVYLLSEGTDSWRPVQAIQLESDIYSIIDENTNLEDEQWQFNRGDVVRCKHTTLHNTTYLECIVAVEKIGHNS